MMSSIHLRGIKRFFKCKYVPNAMYSTLADATPQWLCAVGELDWGIFMNRYLLNKVGRYVFLYCKYQGPCLLLSLVDLDTLETVGAKFLCVTSCHCQLSLHAYIIMTYTITHMAVNFIIDPLDSSNIKSSTIWTDWRLHMPQDLILYLYWRGHMPCQ